MDFAKRVFNNWMVKMKAKLIKALNGVACIGIYTIEVVDEKTGIARKYVYKNLVPTVGRQALAAQIAGTNSQEMQGISIELGTGTTAPANGDTAMETATHRKALGSAAISSNVATLSTFFSAADLAGAFTFREVGLIGDGSAVAAQAAVVGGTGILYSRVAINVAVTAVEAITIEYTITFT